MKMRTSKATAQKVRTSSKMCTSILLVAVLVVVERVGGPLLAHGVEAVDWTALPGLEVGRQLVLLTPHERGQGLHKGNSL